MSDIDNSVETSNPTPPADTTTPTYETGTASSPGSSEPALAVTGTEIALMAALALTVILLGVMVLTRSTLTHIGRRLDELVEVLKQ